MVGWEARRLRCLHDRSPRGDPSTPPINPLVSPSAESVFVESLDLASDLYVKKAVVTKQSPDFSFRMSNSSLPREARISKTTVEQLVGRSINDLSLYRRALTHRSLLRVYPEHALQSNERLEFLGDALLDLLVGEVLYEHFPMKDEGTLTRLRARLVSEQPLATYARHLDLGTNLLMSNNAARGEGRDNPSILADAFEAVVGAVYLDQGYDAVRTFVHEQVLAPLDLQELASQDENYKSQLLELMQAWGRSQPTYKVVEEEGPSHDKSFTVEVRIGDTAYKQGTAGNKQEAEQRAARRSLEHITEKETTS